LYIYGDPTVNAREQAIRTKISECCNIEEEPGGLDGFKYRVVENIYGRKKNIIATCDAEKTEEYSRK
jgi:hypothetical protein